MSEQTQPWNQLGNAHAPSSENVYHIKQTGLDDTEVALL